MDVIKTLKENDFHFNKKYGQNFITDTNLLDAIAADSGADKNDVVLEIGAGAGTLTLALAKKAKRVISFEIDENLRPILGKNLEGIENVSVIYADILRYGGDLAALIGGKYKIVANLPYYITTPIIFNFLYDENLQSLTIMVQKEVAERMCARAGTPAYGALSAQVQLMGEVKIVRHVSRQLFCPSPDVDSAIVRVDIAPKCDRALIDTYSRVVAAAFAMRRKTLVNNLISAFSLRRAEAEELLAKASIDIGVRGETLDVYDFMRLSNAMEK